MSLQPTYFTIYNGKTDHVEHVSHFNQRMVIHSKNKALICKVFPSNLCSVAFEELTRAFGAQIVTCNKVPRPLDYLLSMSMREGKTLKNYSDRYWEIYNEIDGDFEDVAMRTFKVGLPSQSDLWKSITMKPPRSMHQLMDQIEEHKRVEDNQSSNKGKAKAFSIDQRDSSASRFPSSRPRREFYN